MANIKLNSAESNVWNFYYKNLDNVNLSLRIQTLNGSHEFTPQIKKELRSLLKEEKTRLEIAENEANLKIDILRKISEVSNKIKNDDRLLLHLDKRLEIAFKNEKINTPEDVQTLFHEMMVEDMEIDSHIKMIKDYEEFVNSGNEEVMSYEVNLSQEDVDYVYNDRIFSDEVDYLGERLKIFNENIAEEFTNDEARTWLMLRIIRLEHIINETYGEDIEDDE